MRSGVPWWSLPMIPNWVGKWALWKGEPPFRKTWIVWKSRLIKTIWSQIQTNVRSCTWENIIQECTTGWVLPGWGKALWKGIWGSSWTTSLIRVNSVLLRQSKPTGCWATSTRASPAEINTSLSHSTQRLSGHTWNNVFSFGPCYTKKVRTGWRGSREEPQSWSKDWEACRMRKGWENWVCSDLRKKA